MNYKEMDLYNIVDWDAPKYKVLFEQSSVCPVCKIATNDNIIDGYYSKKDNTSSVIIYTVRRCCCCGELTFNKFNVSLSALLSNQLNCAKWGNTQFPQPREKHSFNEAIENISPNFIKIYSEASTAENEGLFEICGMGYRKALEFLVKDYLIHIKPECVEQISKEQLMDSVRRIEDTKVKTLVERTLWLGNDECHYNRKQEDYDINDLKSFIFAIVTAIEYDITFTKALGVPRK